jgi:predicted RNA-binding protein with PUA-like domain
VKAGDRILFYHTGKEKAVVGEMKAVGDARPAGDDGKLAVVEVALVRSLPQPVPLSRIKADASLADFDLVRQSRLSVMPVTVSQWRRIEELASEIG